MPRKTKMPKIRTYGAVRATQHAAANPKPKRKRRVPKVAPSPTYTHAKSTAKPKKKKPGAIKRLVKFVRGDYNK